MRTLPLTVQIPESNRSFLEDYTRRHQISISQLIDNFIEQLRISEGYTLHPDLKEFSGVLPADIDGEREYYAQFEDTQQ